MAANHPADQPRPYNARGITFQPLPSLELSTRKTSHPSTAKKIRLNRSQLTHWTSFEREVQYYTRNLLDPNSVAITHDAPRFRDQETVICATEHGVVGRFQQEVGHVMNRVARELSLNYRFGDWYDPSAPDSLPDMAIWYRMASEMYPVVAGEAKTPWTQTAWPSTLDPANGRLQSLALTCIGKLTKQKP